MDVKALRDEEGRLTYKVSHPKYSVDITIRKSEDGTPFYQIFLGKSNAPQELSGRFTNPFIALQTLKSYLAEAKETVAARRDRVYAENHPEKVDGPRSGKKG